VKAPKPLGKKRKRGKKLSKHEVAEVLALRDMGTSKRQIALRGGMSANTVDKYLAEREAYTDPRMELKIQQIKEKEIWDLTVLNVRAKDRLHDLAPSMNPIEAIAMMDRTFQQLRLLEGKSTANVQTLTKIIQEAHEEEK
jgi:predicted transcriptional regulator